MLIKAYFSFLHAQHIIACKEQAIICWYKDINNFAGRKVNILDHTQPVTHLNVKWKKYVLDEL